MWQESGGPTVQAPKRKGFGTTIIKRSVPYDLGGQANIEYAPEGVRAEFLIPSRHVSDARKVDGPTIHIQRSNVSSQHPVDIGVAGQKSVLLVEDSLIIALDAEDILNRLGASVSTASIAEATHDLLDEARFDFAILDINLGDQTSLGIADRLQEQGVPYFFASGYGEQASLPMEHRSATVVQKPYTTHNVAKAVQELFA